VAMKDLSKLQAMSEALQQLRQEGLIAVYLL
jgi:peptide subunit release factor RF-3